MNKLVPILGTSIPVFLSIKPHAIADPKHCYSYSECYNVGLLDTLTYREECHQSKYFSITLDIWSLATSLSLYHPLDAFVCKHLQKKLTSFIPHSRIWRWVWELMMLKMN